MTQSMEQLTAAGTGLFLNMEDFSLENKELTEYMLNVMKFYPEVYAFYAGTKEGKFIEVHHLALAQETHFISDPSKLLPSGSVYAQKFVDRTATVATEKWIYKNADFQTTGSESIPNPTYDSRQRPWYKQAQEGRHLIWTDAYHFQPSNILGITVAKPAFNKLGEMIAIVGADLILGELSNFLSSRNIGTGVMAFILNTSGEIVVAPQDLEDNRSPAPQELVSTVFKKSQGKGKDNFKVNVNNVDYLAAVNIFPLGLDQTWLIAIIVPFRAFFGEMLDTQRYASFMSLGILIFSGILAVFFSRRISHPIVKLSEEVDKIKNLDFGGKIEIKSNIKEINLIISSVKSMKAAIHAFVRYVPRETVNQLMRKGQQVTIAGEKKEVSIFFLDIEGFTTLSETLSMDVLMPLLAEYFEALSKIIIDSEGTIDKYMGDNIMAFWGAPSDVADYCGKACNSALRSQVFISQFNQKQKEQSSSAFRARIGIHEGEVIVGNIGTPKQVNYTVMGDAVSISSQLESLNKVYRTHIIISEDIHRKIAEEFVVRPIDFIAVKGRKEKMKIFELMAKKEGGPQIAPTEDQLELSKSFTQAFMVYHEGKLSEAKALFESILQRFPADYPTQLYIERINALHP